jgi:hypothetical protein
MRLFSCLSSQFISSLLLESLMLNMPLLILNLTLELSILSLLLGLYFLEFLLYHVSLPYSLTCMYLSQFA